MKPLIIRAVDSGNIQRSPTFQAIFSHHYSGSDKLPYAVVFDSAGIDVDRIMANNTPVIRKLEIIDAGRHYGLIRDKNRILARELLEKWSGLSETQIPDTEKLRITRLYSEVKTDVHTQQMSFRNQALLDAGIPEQYLPGMRVPFRQDESLRLILPVEPSVVRKIDEFYRPLQGRQPPTIVYGDLTGISPLNDELTGGLETARKQVRYFLDTREKAMDAIVELLSETIP